MFAVVFAALAALGTAGDLHLRGDLQSSQSVRSTDNDAAPDIARAELTLAPRLSLDTDGRLRLQLAYAPSIVVPADISGNTPELSGSLAERSAPLHRALAAAELTLPAWVLRAGGSMSTGEVLQIGDPTAGPPAGQPVSTTSRVRQIGGDVTAGATGTLTPRTTLALTSGFSQSGGADDEARALLPLLQEVRGGVVLSYELARRHTLGLDVQANRTRIGEEASGDAGYLRAAGRWGRELTRALTLGTAAGIALAWERDATVDAPPVLPWLEALLAIAPGGMRPSGQIGIALAPVVDRFSGELETQANASASATWAPFRRWVFGLRGSTSAQFGSGDATSDAGAPHTLVHAAGLSAGHEFSDRLRLTASAGSTWQLTEREDLLQFREDLVVVELSAGLFAF